MVVQSENTLRQHISVRFHHHDVDKVQRLTDSACSSMDLLTADTGSEPGTLADGWNTSDYPRNRGTGAELQD